MVNKVSQIPVNITPPEINPQIIPEPVVNTPPEFSPQVIPEPVVNTPSEFSPEVVQIPVNPKVVPKPTQKNRQNHLFYQLQNHLFSHWQKLYQSIVTNLQFSHNFKSRYKSLLTNRPNQTKFDQNYSMDILSIKSKSTWHIFLRYQFDFLCQILAETFHFLCQSFSNLQRSR